jgi:hypothetical protein
MREMYLCNVFTPNNIVIFWMVCWWWVWGCLKGALLVQFDDQRKWATTMEYLITLLSSHATQFNLTIDYIIEKRYRHTYFSLLRSSEEKLLNQEENGPIYQSPWKHARHSARGLQNDTPTYTVYQVLYRILRILFNILKHQRLHYLEHVIYFYSRHWIFRVFLFMIVFYDLSSRFNQ